MIALIEVAAYKEIKVITKLPNSEQSYKGKVKTHNYIGTICLVSSVSAEKIISDAFSYSENV
jgi:hypothetical protein